MDSLDLATEYLKSADELYLEKGDKNGLIENYNNLAKLSLKKSLFIEGERYLNGSMEVLEETEAKNLYLEYISLCTALLDGQKRYVEALSS